VDVCNSCIAEVIEELTKGYRINRALNLVRCRSTISATYLGLVRVRVS